MHFIGEEKAFVHMKQLVDSTRPYIILANSTKSHIIWCGIAWLGVEEPSLFGKEEFCPGYT